MCNQRTGTHAATYDRVVQFFNPEQPHLTGVREGFRKEKKWQGGGGTGCQAHFHLLFIFFHLTNLNPSLRLSLFCIKDYSRILWYLPRSCLFAYLLTCLSTHLPTCLSNYLPAFLHAHKPTCQPANMPSSLLTCLSTSLPTNLLSTYHNILHF